MTIGLEDNFYFETDIFHFFNSNTNVLSLENFIYSQFYIIFHNSISKF